MMAISRGFHSKRSTGIDQARVPPGQYVTPGFPVLSAGPTPKITLAEWTFTIRGAVARPRTWTWDELLALPGEEVTTDIHCVTKWSKLGTRRRGVSLDVLLGAVGSRDAFALAFSDGGYTTNLPVADLSGGRAWLVHGYDGKLLAPEHGGPVRLLVPHLYFWKSAKWVQGLELLDEDRPGFWENYGYHNYGDPWREQRYAGD
ncbi:MAG TPA: sulfite oxidase-like oxidoreductase [Amycolatopsis sp.]|nr:sulfite oxidase-like oxidoreductase [Amycolatopsis sp.]